MEEIKLSITLPVNADKLYSAWLNSRIHTLFTGGEASIKSTRGATFTAWDGYIFGKNLELKKGEYIKQSWRTVEFQEDWPDSILELCFTEKNGKTKLELYHYNLQKGQAEKYKKGWKEHYFKPMKKFFSDKAL